ncbi:MAG: sensor domain-containing diguanylate cyclase [Oscillospiraceae bacterium]|nr:sensor domain-containing diguanylate cyclase [Oscillospiraceae bacterium]
MELEKLYLTIINNLLDGVYFVNKDRRITFWNDAAENITGYKADEIVGQCCQDNLLNHIDSDGRALCLLGCPLFATIIDGRQRKDTVFLQHKEGHRIPVYINIIPMMEDGAIIGAIEVFTQSSSAINDNTVILKLLDMQLNSDLSGVTNRGKTESYIAYRLNELKRFQKDFCVIFFNMDNFKQFNDLYGHETVEKLLKNVYKSINYNIRPSDFFSHWSSDAFIGVFEISKKYEATLLAEKIRILVAGSDVPHDLKNLSITASFGVTVAREDDTVDSVVQRADALMRQSKAKNKNCVSSDA